MDGYALCFLAYGTVIPCLRRIVYRNMVPEWLARPVGEHVYELEELLYGRTVSERSQEGMARILDVYQHASVDPELIQLIEDLHASGCAVLVQLPDGLAQNCIGTETTRHLLEKLPEYVTTSYSWDDVALSNTCTIWVTSNMEFAQEMLERGNQVILYDSPGRLRRELNLRGVLSETTHNEDD